MSFGQSLISAILALSLGSSFVCARSEDEGAGYTLQVAAFPESAGNDAEEFVAKLTQSGEQPIWGLIEIPGKGQWMRVFIGAFNSPTQARQYGEKLVARRIIKEFIIKKASEIKMLSRPRTVGRKKGRALQIGGTVSLTENNLSASVKPEKTTIRQSGNLPPQNTAKAPPEIPRPPLESTRPPTVNTHAPQAQTVNNPNSRPVSPQTVQTLYHRNATSPSALQKAQTSFIKASKEGLIDIRGEAKARHLLTSQSTSVASLQKYAARKSSIEKTSTLVTLKSAEILPQLKITKSALLKLAPAVDLHSIPRADPLQVAFSLIANSGHKKSSLQKLGGLWLSGDREEGLARLQWIVGKDYAALINLDQEGRVQIDGALLASLAKIKEADPLIAPLLMLDFIWSNEGLLLLVQLTQGSYRYRLHLGRQAATAGGDVAVPGSINLDNNFDSRINPYRRLGKKMDVERPPFGFDCLVAINPEARWFNLPSNRLVQVGNITFHELVEAYAKVGLGYEYLPTIAFPGAHNIAIEREMRLKEQRPFANLVLTVGSNRMLKSEDELRQFYAETNGARQQ
jgi:hypothetical protein